MPTCGRALGSTLSIFTTRAGRPIRAGSPGIPSNGAAGTGAVVVVASVVVVVLEVVVGGGASSPPPTRARPMPPASMSTATAPAPIRFVVVSKAEASNASPVD